MKTELLSDRDFLLSLEKLNGGVSPWHKKAGTKVDRGRRGQKNSLLVAVERCSVNRECRGEINQQAGIASVEGHVAFFIHFVFVDVAVVRRRSILFESDEAIPFRLRDGR